MKLTNYSDVHFAHSTKVDGNMSFLHGDEQEVVRNRKLFLEKQGLQIEDCAVMSVEHKDKIVKVNKSDRGKGSIMRDDAIRGEVLVTDSRGIVLFC